MIDLFSDFTVDRALLVPMVMIVCFLIYGWHEDVQRTIKSDRESKLPLYNRTMLLLWGLAASCLAGWMLTGRPIEELGMAWTLEGWRGWLAWSTVAIGAMYLAYTIMTISSSAAVRNQIRVHLDAAELDFLRPRNNAEHRRFRAVSLTAGITEELIFRGFLVAVLSIQLPLFAAAAVSVTAFGLSHLYQGLSGVIRTAIVGAVFTAIFLIGGSLWPVIILHTLLDLAAGVQFQVTDAYEEADRTEQLEPANVR